MRAPPLTTSALTYRPLSPLHLTPDKGAREIFFKVSGKLISNVSALKNHQSLLHKDYRLRKPFETLVFDKTGKHQC